MLSWLKKQWEDIRGNFKFYLLTILGVGVLSAVTAIVHGLAWWQESILVALFALMLAWALVATFHSLKSKSPDPDSLITPENVKPKIREWLDTFNILHGVKEWEPWHFRFDVTYGGVIIFLGRPKTFAGRYLTLQVRTAGVSTYATQFAALSPSDRTKFYGELAIEIARAKMMFTADDELTDIMIHKFIPITNDLKESDVIEGVNEIYQSAMLIWNTIKLRLSDRPKISHSALTPNSESPPISATPPSPEIGTEVPEQ